MDKEDLMLLSTLAMAEKHADPDGTIGVSSSLIVDTITFTVPVPVIAIAMDHDMSRTAMTLLKKLLKPEPLKRSSLTSSAWMKWPGVKRPLYTKKLRTFYSYRDSEVDETLRLSIHIAQEAMPNADPTARIFAEGVKLINADRNWFPFKAAFQRCGWVLVVGADMQETDPETTVTTWRLHYDWPFLLTSEVDFTEIGTWERIAASTEDAHQALQNRTTGM